MNELVAFENPRAQKSFVSTFNARRPDKLLKFNAELAHFQSQIASSTDKDLVKCTQDSFQMALLESASLGLSWNKRLGHCYPVRYKNTCTLHIGYQGLTHLCMKSGVLKSIQGEVVCKNDPVFDNWVDEKGEHINHKKARTNRGAITHAYCIAHFNNGGYHIEVIEGEDLAKIQKAAKTNFVWAQWIIPMSIKAAIRRAWKFWPKDDGGRIEAAMDAMDKSEPMDFGQRESVEEDLQYLTITEDDELTLHALVHDAKADLGEPQATLVADKWMRLICDKFGIRELKQMPADRFDEAKNTLTTRL